MREEDERRHAGVSFNRHTESAMAMSIAHEYLHEGATTRAEADAERMRNIGDGAADVGTSRPRG